MGTIAGDSPWSWGVSKSAPSDLSALSEVSLAMHRLGPWPHLQGFSSSISVFYSSVFILTVHKRTHNRSFSALGPSSFAKAKRLMWQLAAECNRPTPTHPFLKEFTFHIESASCRDSIGWGVCWLTRQYALFLPTTQSLIEKCWPCRIHLIDTMFCCDEYQQTLPCFCFFCLNC